MTDSSTHEAFERALEHFADGYSQGMFDGSRWGVTVKRSPDHKRIWLYAEDLAGTDIVSFNLYRLEISGTALKPCEMSSDKVVAFVLGYHRETC
ncbi:hypothetical protein [Rhizobium glycinendophyticum]|uniref:Uncharacterized protein n=1 Tax=Rhizobium glycinendophyticum TaxID=2589807 RepID=A0A504TWU2_9HYPH|nr:hypothetical protein [Rhizobium glycinendophyticum]TPP05867.1 hypothetical protein FJQ55_19195 [Rhizobium glycinendophyticum]